MSLNYHNSENQKNEFEVRQSATESTTLSVINTYNQSLFEFRTKLDNLNIWLTATETATLCNTSVRTIQRYIKENKFNIKRIVIDRGGPHYEINLSCLPPVAQELYWAKKVTVVGGTDPVEPKSFRNHSVSSSALFFNSPSQISSENPNGPQLPKSCGSPVVEKGINSHNNPKNPNYPSPFCGSNIPQERDEHINLSFYKGSVAGGGASAADFISPIPENLTGYSDAELTMSIYCEAPAYNRRQADKYLKILKECTDLKGNHLKSFIKAWNANFPEYHTSYKSVLRAKQTLQEEGIVGLLGNYGKNYGKTGVKDDWFDAFKKLYLVEGAPSLQSCWVILLGKLQRMEGVNLQEFPKPVSFLRRLEREIPEQSIYLARYGRAAWNKKYANFINRDYSEVNAGQCWVSDHAQIDVAVKDIDGKIYFPWITAWRDFKTGKWLGWLLHIEAPNSDHIFQSFYYAALAWGLPEEIYIDNGKDYRSKDFAGGRGKQINAEINIERAKSMINLIGVIAHFAKPYNAQAKPIERDFNKIKEMFSKHLIGYRGGHVKERPEKLLNEIKSGQVVAFKEFENLFNIYINNVLNKMPGNGKVLQGRSADQVFAEEFTEKRKPSKDELRLFCMRSSNVVTITRNGIRDTKLQITYWSSWMAGAKGEKVYFRRDVNSYQEAWVFSAKDDRYLGKAEMQGLVPALAKTDLDRKKVEKALKIQKENEKFAKSFLPSGTTDLSEIIQDLEAGAKVLSGETKEADPKIIKVSKTQMADALQKEKAGNKESKELKELKELERKINDKKQKERQEAEMPIFTERWRAEKWLKENQQMKGV